MDETAPFTAIRLEVRGAVQGVGFRPFVYRLASTLGLAGSVRNTPTGVELWLEGPTDRIEAFTRTWQQESPKGALIESVTQTPSVPRGVVDFVIERSEEVSSDAPAETALSIGPDLATCAACLAELLNEADRRHGYPFLNCTDCGPRYSIATGSPYDRPLTTMADFTMCSACAAEYADPLDRRFHAQPNACPDCGPKLSFMEAKDGASRTLEGDPLSVAVKRLRDGEIVAVLGIGGFHLMVRADDEEAVARLRTAKRRGNKPFAVMFRDVAEVGSTLGRSQLTEAERDLLDSPAAPIVLVRCKHWPESMAPSVAPKAVDLGCMVAYTPLHHLLLRALGVPLVATSGNARDEPIATSIDEARERLSGLCTAFLYHDRAIVRPVEDSVVRVIDGEPFVLRRGRGHAPLSFRSDTLPDFGIDLALGGHQKTTVAVRVGQRILISPHIGDLETLETRRQHERSAHDLQELLGVRATRVIRDRHPDYASTLLAESLGLPVVAVGHHRAHVEALAFEHAVRGPFLAFAWDGTGYGDDGSVWGAEAFAANAAGALTRVGSIEPFPLPGGESAAREPWRCAVGLVTSVFGDAPPAPLMERLEPFAESAGPGALERAVLGAELARSRTSSMGRLFDAVAAILGLAGSASFEAEAACLLEGAAARHGIAASPYPVSMGTDGGVMRLQHRPWLDALSDDLDAALAPEEIAARFHATLVACIMATASRAGASERVLLTGGCFQNRVLLESTIHALRADGFDPVWPQRIPANDGGLCVGQLLSAVRRQATTASPD